jgi:DNA-binding GntR family transcriptional regulator
MPLPQPVARAHRHTLADEVYRIMLSKITEGEFEPGKILNDKVLAKRLGVSRTPVPEAFRRLTTVHLIEIVPNKYTRVAPINKNRLLEVSSTLFVLHEVALREGIHTQTELDTAALDQSATCIVDAAHTNDSLNLTKHILEYFQLLTKASKNRTLLELVNRLALQLGPVSGRLHVFNSSHEMGAAFTRLHSAVRAGDSNSACHVWNEITALNKKNLLNPSNSSF